MKKKHPYGDPPAPPRASTCNPFLEPEPVDWAKLEEELVAAYQQGSAAYVQAMVEQARQIAGDGLASIHTAGSLPMVDLRDWEDRSPPDREFVWGNWFPLKQVTLLTGQGGVGKSMLGLMLMVCIALGIPFLGMETRKMKVLFATAEDDRDELWRRLAAICDWLGVSIADLRDRLFLVSLYGETDTALATYDDDGQLVRTERWEGLRQAILGNQIQVFALDNVTDLYAGDIIDLHQVAQFINLLTGLAIDVGGACLLFHHPNKDGNDWLGSMAWHNKVRSRWLLAAGDKDGDPDLRKLTNPKANYGPSGGEIVVRWFKGAFVRDDELPEDMREGLESAARAAADNDIFLACLREMTRQGRAVSELQSPTYAPAKFAEMPEAKAIGRRRLEAAMNRLFRLGRIERAELWRRDDRKTQHGLREVE